MTSESNIPWDSSPFTATEAAATAAHQASMNRINNDMHPLSDPDYVAGLAHGTAQSLDALRKRVEALEQRPITGTVELAAPTPEAAPVATDDELQSLSARTWRGSLRACYDLGRQHGAGAAAQPAPPAAPAGGLVERVGEAMERHHVMGDIEGSWDAQAHAVIREVAAWLRQENLLYAAELLEQEADR